MFGFNNLSSLILNLIAWISIIEFFLNFKIIEFEHELEPGDLALEYGPA